MFRTPTRLLTSEVAEVSSQLGQLHQALRASIQGSVSQAYREAATRLMVESEHLADQVGWHMTCFNNPRAYVLPVGLAPKTAACMCRECHWAAAVASSRTTFSRWMVSTRSMSAVVADRMTGDRHNPNVELIAQGADLPKIFEATADAVSEVSGGHPDRKSVV